VNARRIVSVLPKLQRAAIAVGEGDLPPTADPDVLAAFVNAVTHGLAVQAKAGFTRDKLEAVAEQALSTRPATG
jgi:hypothetical protein